MISLNGIKILLNGIMVKDHGITDHGQSPWSVKTWSSPWTSQGCAWTLTMVSVHVCPWTFMFYYMEPWSETIDSVTMVWSLDFDNGQVSRI